jgi:hypothetical protein
MLAGVIQSVERFFFNRLRRIFVLTFLVWVNVVRNVVGIKPALSL